MYLKDKKIRKKKCNISGGVDNSCTTVDEIVQMSKPLQNLYEGNKYPKDKGKKRKSKGNGDNVLDKLCAVEQSRCEVGLEDVQNLVEEEGRERKMPKKEGNEEDNKVDDDIFYSIMNVNRTSEHVITRPDISARESQANGVMSSIKMDIITETIQDNEFSITKDTGAKHRRKRTRRHKKKHKVEDNNIRKDFQATFVEPRRETPIRSVAAPRTHIRFSDSNDNINIDTVKDKVETCHIASQAESEHAYTSHVSSELSSLELLVTSTDVGAGSSELIPKESRQLRHLSSDQQISTKWDVQASDTSQHGDLPCSGSSSNSNVFAKLLAFENSSTPQVYQRKKNSVTTDGAIQEVLSNADMETRQEVKTGDDKKDFSEYPILKETPKEKDIIAFKVGFAYITCRILFPLFLQC
jgi:hypothetical protein